MTSAQKICRLCLDATPATSETLNSCRVGMLKVISLDFDTAVTEEPHVCSKCLEILQQSFFFKTTCLSNEDYLKTFLPCDNSIKLVLEEIVPRNGPENGVKREEEGICRFCLRYFDVASFVKLNNVEEDIFLSDMLQKCLPEIQLGITEGPLMCCNCMACLQVQFNFVILCLDNDEKVKDYMMANGMNNYQKVDLGNVLCFVNNLKRHFEMVEVELTRENLCGSSNVFVVKQEECEEIGDDEFHVKIEENFLSETDNAIVLDRHDQLRELPATGAQTSQNLYSCTECSYITNRKDSLRLHYLVHEDVAKPELFKCEKCDFQTKWRSSLAQHLLIHRNVSDIVKYKCADCPYESKYKRHLRRHCRRHMNVDQKPYHCQYCPWRCSDRWNLKQHNKNKHGKVVTLKNDELSCSKCHFRTAYKAELYAHKKEKHIQKHICECGYTSQKLYHFQQHSLRHKDSSEVVMFNCDNCQFQTKYKNSYKTHMRLHQAGKVPAKRNRGRTERTDSASGSQVDK